MASCVKNIPTENYQNLLIGFQVIVKNFGDFFDTQLRSALAVHKAFELIMTSRQDLTLPVKFYQKLTVYAICCVDEKISNILDLLHEGPQCAGPESEPHALCHKYSTEVRLQICDCPTNCRRLWLRTIRSPCTQ